MLGKAEGSHRRLRGQHQHIPVLLLTSMEGGKSSWGCEWWSPPSPAVNKHNSYWAVRNYKGQATGQRTTKEAPESKPPFILFFILCEAAEGDPKARKARWSHSSKPSGDRLLHKTQGLKKGLNLRPPSTLGGPEGGGEGDSLWWLISRSNPRQS